MKVLCQHISKDQGEVNDNWEFLDRVQKLVDTSKSIRVEEYYNNTITGYYTGNTITLLRTAELTDGNVDGYIIEFDDYNELYEYLVKHIWLTDERGKELPEIAWELVESLMA